jgi:hypothetical protein
MKTPSPQNESTINFEKQRFAFAKRFLPFGIFILYAAILTLLAGFNDQERGKQSSPSLAAEIPISSLVVLK